MDSSSFIFGDRPQLRHESQLECSGLQSRTFPIRLASETLSTSYSKIEDPSIGLRQALSGRHHLDEERWVYGQTGQGGQQPTVTWRQTHTKPKTVCFFFPTVSNPCNKPHSSPAATICHGKKHVEIQFSRVPSSAFHHKSETDQTTKICRICELLNTELVWPPPLISVLVTLGFCFWWWGCYEITSVRAASGRYRYNSPSCPWQISVVPVVPSTNTAFSLISFTDEEKQPSGFMTTVNIKILWANNYSNLFQRKKKTLNLLFWFKKKQVFEHIK